MSHFILHIPASIHLYQEGDLKGLRIEELGRYLEEKTHIPFQLHGDIYKGLPEGKVEAVAKEYARIKVKDPGKKFVSGLPLQAEIDYEERRLKDPQWRIFGIFYEGVWYQKIVSELIDKEELDLTHCSILFTNQLFGTWDRGDLKYHARVSLYGFPSLISTTGLVEAPAKPKGFYLKKQMGVPIELLKEEYQELFLDHGDVRTTGVLKGYAMQALFFHLSGEPFCEDPDCRLFNSHWQEEVIHAQLNGRYEFCSKHEGILKAIKDRSHKTLASLDGRGSSLTHALSRQGRGK